MKKFVISIVVLLFVYASGLLFVLFNFPALTENEFKPPPPPIEAPLPDPYPGKDVLRGRSLYKSRGCNSCHGDYGEGIAGPALVRWHSYQEFYTRVLNGSSKGNYKMPAYKGAVSEIQLWQLYRFVTVGLQRNKM